MIGIVLRWCRAHRLRHTIAALDTDLRYYQRNADWHQKRADACRAQIWEASSELARLQVPRPHKASVHMLDGSRRG